MNIASLLKLICLSLVLTSAGSSQSYTPLYVPLSSTQLYAACFDPSTGVIQPNCAMTLTTGYYPNTNGHFHNTPTPPQSYFTPSSVQSNGSGYAPVTLTTTIVGHAEYAVVCPVSNPVNGCRRSDYAVGYTLYWVYHPEAWVQNGGTVAHGDVTFNHWMTTTAAYGIYNATLDYKATYGGTVFSNDMGLPFGGKFDINQDWTTDHYAHDEGTAADINGIPSSNESFFRAFCIARGAVDARTEGNGSQHCRWN